MIFRTYEFNSSDILDDFRGGSTTKHQDVCFSWNTRMFPDRYRFERSMEVKFGRIHIAETDDLTLRAPFTNMV